MGRGALVTVEECMHPVVINVTQHLSVLLVLSTLRTYYTCVYPPSNHGMTILCSPCFGLFSEILDTVENRNRINSVAVYSFLKTVLAHPFPERGGTVEVKTLNPKTGKLEELVLSRPDSSDPMIEYVLYPSNCSLLFSDPDLLILQLLGSL